MLGQQIGELTGKRIVRRVLSTEPPKAEVSFEDGGTYLGVAVTGFGTYTAVVRPDGTALGEGEGVMFTQDGDLVTWKGNAMGHFKERGAISYRGILYYRTASQKLAQLNKVAGVFEYEIDPEGKTTAKIWEWK